MVQMECRTSRGNTVTKEKPRILTFQHFRNRADMTPEQLELL